MTKLLLGDKFPLFLQKYNGIAMLKRLALKNNGSFRIVLIVFIYASLKVVYTSGLKCSYSLVDYF